MGEPQALDYARIVRRIWILLAVAAVMAFLGAPGSTGKAMAGLYLLGWVFLWLARRRDPDGAVLAEFWASRAGRVTFVAILLVAQVLSFFVSALEGLLLLEALAVFGLLLWALHRTGAALARTAARVLLLCCSFLVVVVVGEFVFRLPSVVARTGGNNPGARRWEEQEYDRLWTKNLMPFRSFHLDEPKPEGAFRILALGDSYTWGDKIAKTEDTWPYQLESLLAKDRSLQVINLGMKGYTTVNELELLRRLGWRYEPDLVVLQYTINDPLPSGPNFQRQAGTWAFQTYPLLPVLHETLDHHSYFYSFLDQRFRLIQVERRYPQGWLPLYDDDFAGWRECQQAIRDIHAWTKERGIPLVMVMFPIFLPGPLDEESYLYAGIHAKVGGVAQREGIPFLDLLPLYAADGREGRSWWSLPSDTHPGVEAHRVAAEALAQRIREAGWLGSEGRDGR